MKDSLLNMLMIFFENGLAQITQNNTQNSNNITVVDDHPSQANTDNDTQSLIIKPAMTTSTRVFTSAERIKFTKASYQFLTRMLLWEVIASENIELIINQLMLSESRYVTLQETKWTAHNILAEKLDSAQLAFLDLVLYQKEDEVPLH